MCMSDPVRIESEDVPKYAYKVYYGNSKNKLKTYFKYAVHLINKFNKSDCHKKYISVYDLLVNRDRLHFGRISVYLNEIDAVTFCKNRNPYDYHRYIIQAWKVEIKQTTKYAYEGRFAGKSLAVDQVKPIKRVY